MRRIELLFGEFASRTNAPASGHSRPDATLPLRMQAHGTPRRLTGFGGSRLFLWRRAMRSKACWWRAIFFGALAAAATAMCDDQIWFTVAVGGLVTLAALISGVWARLDILAQRVQSQRN